MVIKVDIIQDQIRHDIIQSEYNRLKLFIGVLIVGFMVMGFLFFYLKYVGAFFKNPYSSIFNMIWIFSFILYNGLGYKHFRPGI
jgi:ABC-type multidrug transport system permease subunit